MRRVEFPASLEQIVIRDQRQRGRVLALCVHQEHRVEDLHGGVGIQRGGDVGDRPQVAVDELAQAAVVFHRAHPGAPADEQLEAGDAEGVLHVDSDQGDFITHRWLPADLVLVCPLARLRAPDLGRPPSRFRRSLSHHNGAEDGQWGISSGCVQILSWIASKKQDVVCTNQAVNERGMPLRVICTLF